MRDSIAIRLAPLASLAIQRLYIVNSTKDEYLIPSDLLNDADDVIRLVRTMLVIRDSLSTTTLQAVLDLEGLLDGASRSAESSISNQDLVEHDPAWRAVREQAALCLSTMGFDLHHWEVEVHDSGA